MSKESKETRDEEMAAKDTYCARRLSNSEQDIWIQGFDASTKYHEKKYKKLLEVIKQVKIHLRAPVHFDALVQMSQICEDVLANYTDSLKENK